jgi:hypothetical protein
MLRYVEVIYFYFKVSFIGIIRNVIKRANDVTYLIDDMTSAEINVKLQSDVCLFFLFSLKLKNRL